MISRNCNTPAKRVTERAEKGKNMLTGSTGTELHSDGKFASLSVAEEVEVIEVFSRGRRIELFFEDGDIRATVARVKSASGARKSARRAK